MNGKALKDRPWKLFVKGAIRGRFTSLDAAQRELNRLDLVATNRGKPRGWVLRHSQIVFDAGIEVLSERNRRRC